MDNNTSSSLNQAGRQPAGHFTINIANGGLQFRPFTTDDPMPSGRQLLRLANLHPADDYSLFFITANGDFEDVLLDETVDITAKGAEQFVAFLTDRSFKFTIRDEQKSWGKPVMSAKEIYRLAQPADGEVVFQEVQGEEPHVVELNEFIDLSNPGIERFITAPKPVKQFDIIINAYPFTVQGKRETFEQIVALAFPSSPADPNLIYVMKYSKAASKPHSGSLSAGGSVEVKNGTVFNVTPTVRS